MPSEDKAIRVIAFSGKQIDWTVWEEKFLAKANLKGYKKILLGNEIAPKDGDDPPRLGWIIKEKEKRMSRHTPT